MPKKMFLIPIFALIVLAIIVGVLFLIIPDAMKIFFNGIWYGIKAPVVFVLKIFNSKFKFYDNPSNSNVFNFGFLIGLSFWSSPAVYKKTTVNSKSA